MKQCIWFVIAFSILTAHGHAQYSSGHPEGRLNMGLVLSDLLILRFKMEAEYRLKGPSALALGAGTRIGEMNMGYLLEEDYYPANDVYIDVGYKYYFARTATGKFPFARFTVAYRNSDVEYFEKQWVPHLREGLTYYHYEDVQQYYHVESLALALEIGVHYRGAVFFTDIGIGALYRGLLSNDRVPEQFSPMDDGPVDNIDYIGFMPKLRAKVGVYIF